MKPLKPFEISFDGVNLVEASAGTGKTYNITSLYIRAIIERDVSVGNLLVVTYTEAATKELKDRLLKRIRQSIEVLKSGEVDDKADQFLVELINKVDSTSEAVEKLEKAVRNFDEAAVHTIHGFCYQSLQEQAFESRALYDAEMIGDDSELVQEAVDDYWRSWTAKVLEEGNLVLLELMKNEGHTPETLAGELGSYIGKPYLKILPEDIDRDHIKKQLSELVHRYEKLRNMWEEKRNELFTLLDTGNLSYYTTNSLNKWFGLMDDFLEPQIPNLDTFTQFYRFKQHNIDNSLNKKAKKSDVQPPQHAFFEEVEHYSQALHDVKNYVTVFKKDLLVHLRNELSKKKEDRQVLSFDDLLLNLRDALADGKRGDSLAGKLARKYPIALVDEFQDTDPSQYEIFRRIYKDREAASLFMIGDPKQSIYSFRGADIFSYIEARRDAPEENMFSLNRNFRSSPRLLEGVNTLWCGHENPFILEDIAYTPTSPGKDDKAYDELQEYGEVNPPVRFRFIRHNDPENTNKTALAAIAAEDASDEIKRLIDSGDAGKITVGQSAVEAKDIAVLVRYHKQADLMRKALQKKGIKSVQYSDKSVFKSEEAYQLEVFLQAVAEPSNESLVKTALSLPFTSISANELLQIENDEQRWIDILNHFLEWNRKWHKQGFASMFRSLLQDVRISEHVINLPEGERRLTNLLHLGELMHNKAQEKGSNHHALIRWLSRKREEEEVMSDEEQLRLESDQALVKIVTMHRSKGLEYPVVFCPFLWYGPEYKDGGEPLVYHDEHREAILDLRGKEEEHRSLNRFKSNMEALAESARLAYVAMTRAKHCLYLSWGYADYSEFSALGYLFQSPEEVQKALAEKLGDRSYNKPDGSNIHDSILSLVQNNPELFTCDRSGKERSLQANLFHEQPHAEPAARVFERGRVGTGFTVSSFSSLTSRAENDPDIPDYDQFIMDRRVRESAPGERSIFTFPRGPEPGTCIHKIFEEIDFRQPESLRAKVEESLSSYGIDGDWRPVVSKHILTVLNKKLLKDDSHFSLSTLHPDDLRAELEFYFKSGEAGLNDLLSIIRKSDLSASSMEDYTEAGFLKGFIDLIFKYEGKFYLLDYKTNHLGDKPGDYGQESMQQEMHHHMYDLQYHIYTIALHRYLKSRLPDYSYATHFGGALYLFIRGINDDGAEGIFFDCPEQEVIERLDSYLMEGQHG